MAVINDIDLSKIEAGEMRLDSSHLICAALLKKFVKWQVADSAAKKIWLYAHVSAEVGLTYRGFSALPSDSVKFTQQCGEVHRKGLPVKIVVDVMKDSNGLY